MENLGAGLRRGCRPALDKSLKTDARSWPHARLARCASGRRTTGEGRGRHVRVSDTGRVSQRFQPWWALALLLCLPTGLQAQQGAAIRSGCETDYPPFCIVHDDGRVEGFSVELLRAALSAMGRVVTFRTGPWDEVRGWLERGEIAALPLVGRTPEREAVFDFTVPYLTMHGAIVVRDETADVRGLDDLRGRRVGVMKGDNAEEFLRRGDYGVEIHPTPTFSDAFRDLAARRCDAVVIQKLVALRLLPATGLTHLKIVDEPVKDFRQDFCFAVREGDRDTLALLNEGLALVVADGTHRRLHAKWFAALELPSDRPLVIGGDRSYPPFSYLDERGRPTGFSVALTKAIAREMNLDVRVQLGPWPEVVDALRQGELDAVQDIFYTTSRDREFDFSPRYAVIHTVSVVRQGQPPGSLAELSGHDVVIQAEDAILEAMREAGIVARVTTVPSQEDVLREVAEGRRECGVATRLGALTAIERHGWQNLILSDDALYSGEASYAVASGQDALLAQFAEGLRILKDKGEYQRLYETWLGVHEPSRYGWQVTLRYVALVALPLLAVALLSLLWSWSLRRKVAERTAALQESERRYRTYVDSATNGVLVTDRDGLLLEANRGVQAMTGYAEDELRGRPVADLLLPAAVGAAAEPLERLFRDGQWSGFLPFRRRDGSLGHWNIQAVRLSEDRMLAITTDLTPMIEAEASLRRSEERFRSLVDGAPDAIFIQAGGCFAYVNHATVQLFGADSPAQLLGQPVVDRFHPDVREQVRQRIQALNVTKQPVPMAEEVCLRLDGSEVTGEVVAVPTVHDGQDGAIVFVRDISERKREERRRALAATADQLRAALAQTGPDGETAGLYQAMRDILLDAGFAFDGFSLCLADPERDRLSWLGANGWQHSLTVAMGQQTRPLEQAWRSGQTVCYADLDRDDPEEVQAALEEEAGQPVRSVVYIPFPHGVVSLYSGQPEAFTPETVAELRQLADVLDEVSTRLAAIWALHESEARLVQSQRLESVGRLAGGVAHDFNNHLTVMLNYAELVGEAIPDGEPAREWLDEITNAVQRSANLTRQLLAFARRQVITPKVLDLNEAVEEMLKMLRRLIGEDIDLAWRPDSGLWPVRIDPSQVDQILANLCVNARDAIGGAGRITIETGNAVIDDAYCAAHQGFQPGSYVRLTVSDNGCGMDRDTLDHIFEPFYTTKGQGEGTGLGLATVYGIVKQNEGFIHAYSEPGMGATFRIYLPRYAGAVEPEGAGASGRELGGSETILLAEDERAIRKTTRLFLERFGYHVLDADDPDAVLQTARAYDGEIDLLITDVVMPGMSGRELAASLSAVRPGLKVIYMSGYTANVLADRGVVDDSVNFLAKPFSRDDLARKVREVLDGDSPRPGPAVHSQ